ncbi:xanthine dehydrogenase family protein molybdopterin-binding subunit [Aquibium sp. A9E412]|uniref:xanthine dehydrogenase family protein molybdopterin-binding subunit n=1 Tax=Aquibium sp. A9E412 TaxID=2976767 RepID=UPI0025AEF547|nr:xanthine dehydrogenase family protein molybdopterin-binding subunit [Aquibium sp. A9E412]MDN2567125.1 xanthine dehydrogenase family protein molybdopterin-binding subunit [Aquibium sp. A9E412]
MSQANDRPATATGVGAALPRREDARFLHGRGRYIADLELPRMLDVAFLRSPLAHAAIRGVEKPEGAQDRVFTAADMAGLVAIRPTTNVPGHRIVGTPPIADERVRFVGEIIAACVADSRAAAEDLVELVMADLDELPVVASVDAALSPDAPLVHESWGSNLSMETRFESGIEEAIAAASVRVTRTLDMARQAMVPLEGKGVVAHWDAVVGQLVVYSSTQSPHLIRNGLCHCLGLQQRQVRVVAPDVGGGFGYKAILHPEEIIVAWLALRLKRPVRWLEDRFEHLTAGASAREHRYEVTAHADAHGRILGIDAVLTTDAGAYSIWPHTNGFDAVQASGILTGPYDIRGYRVHTRTVATNKPPLSPYRAVARPGACFAIETIVDAVARAVGRDPADVRLDNLVGPAAMPYKAVTGKEYDSGDYPACLRRAREMMQEVEADPLPDTVIGTGYAMYTEHTAVSTATIAPLGVQMMPGFEHAGMLMQPDGSLEIRVGVQSHGQGMETTLAQIATEVLGIDPERVTVRHGDTALSPYSTGTYASRAIVMTGGAVAAAADALAERLKRVAGHMMQCGAAEVRLVGGELRGPTGSLSLEEAAHIWHFRPFDLPEAILRDGLELTAGYRPDGDRAPFAYAAHAARVAVDLELGVVTLLDYVAVDDCGTRVNPTIVDGQVLGGVAQGIGTGLFEEVPFDDQGQPLATTFGDYSVPAASEIPMIRLDHRETRSPYTRFGVKGVGEGGAIAPPAAVVNAINDALAGIGAELCAVPATPRRVLEAIFAARDRHGAAQEDAR